MTRADEGCFRVLKVSGVFYTNVLVTSVTPTDIYATCGAIVGNAKLKNLDLHALQKRLVLMR